MSFIFYILFSESKNKFYIRFTSHLEKRLIRHNQKSKGFTGNVNDWRVIYTENYKKKNLHIKENYKLNLGKAEFKFRN